MLVVPLEWAPFILILIIACYACQLLGAAASTEGEVSGINRAKLKQELQGQAYERRPMPAIPENFLPYSQEDASAFDRYESQSRFPRGKVCPNCGNRFRPIADGSSICRCPFCGKGLIL